MAKKKTIMPIPMCQTPDCAEVAAFGARVMIDVTTNDSPNRVKEFIMGDCPNWCLKHDNEMRRKYAGIKIVDLRNA